MVGFAIGAISGAAALGALGYQSMAPTGQWYGKTFTGIRHGSRQIALTYDDGPNEAYTRRLLDVLAKHSAPATFFLIGKYVQRCPQPAREIAAAGHTIGNHTFSHPLLIFKSAAEIRRELVECRKAIEDAVGAHSNLFRPPFGGRRPAVLRIARELGLRPVMWNITGYDWDAPPAEQIEDKVAKCVRGGDVILLHDGGHKQMGADRSQTIIASDRILGRFKQDGFSFVTIDGMIADRRAFSGAVN